MNYSAGKKGTTFGQRVLGYTTRRSESMGSGGGGSLGIRFRDRWAPPQNITTKFRLLPGAYLNFDGEESEYYAYVEHFVKRSNKGFICSKQYQIVDGELTAVGGKCLGCREREAGAEDISWSLKHAFNGLHLAHYHLVPAEDKDGRPIMHKKGPNAGKQATNRRLCEGRKCPHCKEGLEKVFGKQVHWSLGSGHMNELAGFADEIEKDCGNCGEGRLSIAAYECEKCAHPLIDMNTTDMELKAINSYVARKRECPECGHIAVPMKQVDCDNCKDPSPLSIFDCELEIKRQGEGTNSTIQIPRWTRAEIPEDLKELCKPFTFKRIFAPDPFEIQAKILKIKNPRPTSTNSRT
jgi:hypothetical protein